MDHLRLLEAAEVVVVVGQRKHLEAAAEVLVEDHLMTRLEGAVEVQEVVDRLPMVEEEQVCLMMVAKAEGLADLQSPEVEAVEESQQVRRHGHCCLAEAAVEDHLKISAAAGEVHLRRCSLPVEAVAQM